ncbi:hypothetical protein UlMin_013903 [Ulmus minor]
MEQEMEIDLRYYDPNTLLDSPQLRVKKMKYLEAEAGILVADLYDANIDIRRRWALGVISKYSKCEHFDAFIPYLAINYFDRFASKAGVLVVCNDLRDNVLLLAICCLTLAWRVCREKFNLDQFLALRSDLNRIDPLMITNLEANIVRVLFWNYPNVDKGHRGARPLTALSFVKLYVPVFRGTRGFRRKTVYQMIIQSQRDIYFTQFSPSIFAASVLLAACSFLYPKLYRVYFGELYRRQKKFNLDEYTNCVDMMIEFCKAFGLRELGLVVEMAEETQGEASGQRKEASEQAGGETSRQRDKETSEEEQVTDEVTGEEPSRKTDLKGKSIKKDQGVEVMPLKIRPKDSDAGTSPLEPRQEETEDKRSMLALMEMDFELQWVNENDEDITMGSPFLQTGEWGYIDRGTRNPANPDPQGPQSNSCSCYIKCCRPM